MKALSPPCVAAVKDGAQRHRRLVLDGCKHNYCMCALPLMMVAHCAASTRNIRLGTAVVVVPLYNPVRLIAEIALMQYPGDA